MISWVILVIGFFMFIVLMLNLPALLAYGAIGSNLTGYTANTTYWVGFTETVNIVPVFLISLAIVIPVVAWWKARSHGE